MAPVQICVSGPQIASWKASGFAAGEAMSLKSQYGSVYDAGANGLVPLWSSQKVIEERPGSTAPLRRLQWLISVPPARLILRQSSAGCRTGDRASEGTSFQARRLRPYSDSHHTRKLVPSEVSEVGTASFPPELLTMVISNTLLPKALIGPEVVLSIAVLVPGSLV